MKYILSFIIFIAFLEGCGQGLGLVKADKLKDWKIDEYTIEYSRKLGPAGPPYYQYDVYKSNKYLSYAAYIIDDDSCRLLFRERNDYYVRFNLCNKTKTILSADKDKLEIDDIDSITIRPYDSIKVEGRETYTPPFFDTIIIKNFDSTIAKRLDKRDVKTFCKRWNSSRVNGYDRLGKSYDYLVTVYAKTGVRRFRTLNFYVTENELWSYETKEDTFFDKLWLDK